MLSPRRRATPKWSNREDIEAVYREARRLTRTTGIKHHVDHIFPIGGLEVCGLHVAENLQVITRRENLVKNNKPPSEELTRQLNAAKEIELLRSLPHYETANLDAEEDDPAHPLSAIYRAREEARLKEVGDWLAKKRAR